MQLFYAPEGRLRLTLEDRSHLDVVPAWAAPRTHPDRYLSLLDSKGKEILMLERLEDAGADNVEVLRQELRRRYLYSQVRRVNAVRMEFGATYWSVETDRGHRDFVTQSLQENAQWIDEEFLLLIDVEGNHYQVKPVSALDPDSLRRLRSVV
ncbi:MAG: DUF1854 domain-containing protein [Armatimonadota bacterium]|jgi:hypothetical protein|nr:DUF1854 domain-containing protein [Fimbriimonadaceae bacterium]MCZ8138009.1 DUF1854 domain-containing protein [Fimbriimonadaceae bacterium]